MLNSLQVINAYRGLEGDQSSQDTDIDAFLDYLKPAELNRSYRPFTQLFVRRPITLQYSRIMLNCYMLTQKCEGINYV
jgi:hypothetical protein